jgi:hypothetical protein
MKDKTMETLPRIKADEIKKAKEDAWDFLFIFTNKYFEIMGQDPGREIMKDFNASQHTLLAYNYLYGEVMNGGFIQLIQNGYGGYIFDNPFSEIIKTWGAEKIAGIVEEAKVIYNKYKKELEKETSLEEFSKMYSKIKDFEALESQFYDIADKETENIKKYVEENLNEFCIIV